LKWLPSNNATRLPWQQLPSEGVDKGNDLTACEFEWHGGMTVFMGHRWVRPHWVSRE